MHREGESIYGSGDSSADYDVMRFVAISLKAHYIAQFPDNVDDPLHAAIIEQIRNIDIRILGIDPRDPMQVLLLHQQFSHELSQELDLGALRALWAESDPNELLHPPG